MPALLTRGFAARRPKLSPFTHITSITGGWSSGGGDPGFPGTSGLVGDLAVAACVANCSSIDLTGVTGWSTLMDEDTGTGLRRSVFWKRLDSADILVTAGILLKGARFFGMDYYGIWRGGNSGQTPTIATGDGTIAVINTDQNGVARTGSTGDVLLFIGSQGYNTGTLTCSVTPGTGVTRRAAGVAGSGNRVNITVDEATSDGSTVRTHRLQSTNTAGVGSIGLTLKAT